MDPGDAHPAESRPPTVADLVLLCRSLNAQGARYLVIGGFAVNQHGLTRATMDIDLLVDASRENQARVKNSLEVLPDKAIRELRDDDLDNYVVVRVADEVVVDLMTAACGINYEQAARDAETVTIDGVPIPFVSAATLLRMKQTLRDKDEVDRVFLQRLLAERERHGR
jgi:hypothetical protein